MRLHAGRKVRGDEEVIRQLMQAHWNDSRVLLDVSMVYGYMVNFLDKHLREKKRN